MYIYIYIYIYIWYTHRLGVVAAAGPSWDGVQQPACMCLVALLTTSCLLWAQTPSTTSTSYSHADAKQRPLTLLTFESQAIPVKSTSCVSHGISLPPSVMPIDHRRVVSDSAPLRHLHGPLLPGRQPGLPDELRQLRRGPPATLAQSGPTSPTRPPARAPERVYNPNIFFFARPGGGTGRARRVLYHIISVVYYITLYYISFYYTILIITFIIS